MSWDMYFDKNDFLNIFELFEISFVKTSIKFLKNFWKIKEKTTGKQLL